MGPYIGKLSAMGGFLALNLDETNLGGSVGEPAPSPETLQLGETGKERRDQEETERRDLEAKRERVTGMPLVR